MERGYRIAATALWGIAIGLVTGGLVWIYNYGLLFVASIRNGAPFLWIPFLAMAGAVMIFLFSRYGKELQGSISYLLRIERSAEEKIPLRLIPLVIGTTWLTQLFGGSTGRIGGAVEIGATISDQLAQKISWFKEVEQRQSLLLAGMAAGFAAIFQTPFAAIFFVYSITRKEIVFSLQLVPVFTAALSAKYIAAWLGIEKFTAHLPDFSWLSWGSASKILVLSVLFGLVGLLFIQCLKIGTGVFHKWFPNPYWRIVVVSLFLSVTLLLCHSGRYAGLSLELIQASFQQGEIYSYDWLLKLIFSVLALSVGYQGGLATPLFVIGATLGVGLGTFFGIPPMVCAALGYIAVFSSATNTVLAPIMIGIEAFGFTYLPLYIVVCVIANSCNGEQSVFS